MGACKDAGACTDAYGWVLVPVVEGLGGSLELEGLGARGEGTPLKEMFLLWAMLMERGDDRDPKGEGDLIGDGPDRGSGGRPKDQLLD